MRESEMSQADEEGAAALLALGDSPQPSSILASIQLPPPTGKHGQP